jgi:hypothetical protein
MQAGHGSAQGLVTFVRASVDESSRAVLAPPTVRPRVERLCAGCVEISMRCSSLSTHRRYPALYLPVFVSSRFIPCGLHLIAYGSNVAYMCLSSYKIYQRRHSAFDSLPAPNRPTPKFYRLFDCMAHSGSHLSSKSPYELIIMIYKIQMTEHSLNCIRAKIAFC